MTDIYDIVCNKLTKYESTRILDLGAGEGAIGLRLRERNYICTYRAVENNPELILCLKRNHLSAEEGDIAYLDYRKGSWDTVVMKDVLEYLPNLSLLVNAVSFARRLFVLVTEAAITDAISPTPKGVMHYNIDDVLLMAQTASFHMIEFQRFGNHTVLVFRRKWGKG